MIGIIGAMEEEVQALLDKMTLQETMIKKDYKFYIGYIANKACVLVQGGIGKVNAAMSATLLFENYDIDALINIGTAGGLDINENVGDVVISTEVAYHDVDVTACNYQYGQMAGMPATFKADEKLIDLTQEILDKQENHVHLGLVVSGDTFVSQKYHVEHILTHFKEAKCADMEAAAIAQVSTIYKIPFIITRSLSDIFGKGNNDIQFDEYLKVASVASANMCEALISRL